MLDELQNLSSERQGEWEGAEEADLLFFAVEMGGEVGEALNVIKKITRAAKGIKGNQKGKTELYLDLCDELADVIICAANIANEMNINLEDAVRYKFNKTSDKNGLKTRF